jgi:NADPH:quinone reductase-like Zn-dependent oxidoreductase
MSLPRTMRAAVRARYGGPQQLSLCEVPRPAPGPREVLLRVRASSVNQADWYLLTGTPYPLRLMTGLWRPRAGMRVLGLDAAGVVEEVGAQVTRFAPGDEVFGEISGAYAEYACAAEDRLAKKPRSLSFEEAAAAPVAAGTALQGLRDKARVRAGHRVLINGASGGVGSFAVQLARAFGAEVTAVCSARNAAQARALGATHVVDYAKQDFTRTFDAGERYDAIFDLVGSASLRACLGCLRAGGVYVSSVGRLGWVAKAFAASLVWRGTVTVLAAQARAADLQTLAELLEQRRIAPVIERRYGFHQIGDALRAQGEGHARGKSVIALP